MTTRGLLALCAVTLAGSCGRDVPTRPTAHQVLMGYLGHAVSATSVGDTELVIKEIEQSSRPMSAGERNAFAALDVRRIRQHWPDPKLRRVTVVFERLRRFGPLVTGKSDTALVFELPRRDSDAH